jgi:hypothetical protein
MSVCMSERSASPYYLLSVCFLPITADSSLDTLWTDSGY